MTELTRDGLGARDRMDAATMAAWAQAETWKDKRVVDVNGAEVGRLTRLFEEEGVIVRCDVTLSAEARRRFDAPRPVAAFPPHWIAAMDDDAVRLRRAGEELVRPDGADEGDTGAEGAKGLPRKER